MRATNTIRRVAALAAGTALLPAIAYAQYVGAPPQTMMQGIVVGGEALMAGACACGGFYHGIHVWQETHSFARAATSVGIGALLAFGTAKLVGL